MTSNPTTECYVYITLPGQITAVTAGRFTLTTNNDGVSIGQFVYGRRYLERKDKLPIDPVELKFPARDYQTTALNGVFGALRDAGPDYWGRLVIQRYLKRAQIGELEYLLHSPDDRIGALGFGLEQEAPAPKHDFNKRIDLAKLQEIAEAIIQNEELPASIPNALDQLLLVGTSMGGARPKAVIEDQNALWIAKFNHRSDTWNAARVEHAMLVLARVCGIAAAESKVTQVGKKDVLLVKRFDRERADNGYFRSRMVSGLTLLKAEESATFREKWSYIALVEELRRVCSDPRKDAHELFRRICFNALISNADDHPRNHAILAKEDVWGLSPAYDLTPSTPSSTQQRDLAMVCGDNGRFANANNLLSQSARFLLSAEEAEAIINAMEERIRKSWHDIARSEGVSEHDCGLIKSAFNYPGFRF